MIATMKKPACMVMVLPIEMIKPSHGGKKELISAKIILLN
jgi:hypothetical protein